MVVLFVILTLLVFITYDYFVHWRPSNQQQKSLLIPLKKLVEQSPQGVFFFPNFTWASLDPEGTLNVGLNPLLLGLTGKPDRITLLVQPGTAVKAGDPMAVISRNGKKLTIFAHHNGRVKQINPELIEEPILRNWIRNWIFQLETDQVDKIIQKATVGEKTRQFLQDTYNSIKQFISETISSKTSSYAMADGGELPVGVLDHLDSEAWSDFEQKFLKVQI